MHGLFLLYSGKAILLHCRAFVFPSSVAMIIQEAIVFGHPNLNMSRTLHQYWEFHKSENIGQ